MFHKFDNEVKTFVNVSSKYTERSWAAIFLRRTAGLISCVHSTNESVRIRDIQCMAINI